MKKIYLMTPEKIGTVSREIYGHFSEHIGGVFYDGLWVGKDSDIPNVRGFRKMIVDKLRDIHVPVLRWPGGCYAETYDWRDGIGENRPTRVNWWTREDGRYESNEVGTHEFMDFCEMIGTKGYFAANLTSVTPLMIREWMDYCLSPEGSTTLAKERAKNGHPEPFDIPYWGVGNENWGGGGDMRPEFYVDECRRYATIMNNTAPDVELYACGSNAQDYSWTAGVIPGLTRRHNKIRGFAMHYYCGKAGDPVEFTDDEWDQMMRQADLMEKIIVRNWHIICANDMQDQIKLVVDEWGCWHQDGSGPSKGYNLYEQQSTMRDAMVAAHTLNIFNRNCDKVHMANVAQLVNNLHSLFLASGKNCIVTPTYHVFDMYKDHQGAEAFTTYVEDNTDLSSSVSVSASIKNGKMLITLGNLSCKEDVTVSLNCVGAGMSREAKARLLADDDLHAHNTFEDPERVTVRDISLDAAKPIDIPKGAVMAIETAISET